MRRSREMGSLPFVSILLLVGAAAACSGDDARRPWLNQLDDGAGVQDSGARLMALPIGLHELEPPADEGTLLVGVHGYASRGYEWVYPLKRLDRDDVAVYFYRWDFTTCPDVAARALAAAIEAVIAARPTLTQIKLIGHSLGGVLVAQVAKRWSISVPIDVHAVAAPLAGVGPRRERCDVTLPEQLPANVTFSEWRTQHALDGAYKDLDRDPQLVDISGSHVTRLPTTYRGHRLGHNWSISAVADAIVASGAPDTE